MAQNQNNYIKCPGCPCIFFTQSDLKKHLGKFGAFRHVDAFTEFHKSIEYGNDESDPKTEWTKSQYGEGEICLAEKKPQLKVALMSRTKIQDSMYTYQLVGKEKKWVKRIPITSSGK